MTEASSAPNRSGAFLCALLVLLFVVLGSWPGHAEIKFPELTGRIVDNAGLLKPEDRSAIEAELAVLEAKASDQLVVVTLPSLQGYEIEEYGYQLGRKWGIGRAGKNNGALLIVAPNERKVRIEVGRGLEPLLTDLMSKIIIENAILPEFRHGNFPAGVRAGVRDIKATLLGDAEGVKERARGRDAIESDWVPLLILAFWAAIVLYVVWTQYRYMQQASALPGGKRRSRYRDNGVVVVPGSGSGNWGGGGWSSGGGGDSGWSGGGGDFGGGGGSGSW
ncbi:MAG: TPM domain-containing protein [Hyphomicrobium sp.]